MSSSESNLPDVLNAIDLSLTNIRTNINQLIYNDNESSNQTKDKIDEKKRTKRGMDDLLSNLPTSIDKAKLNVTLAYTLNTLLYNYVKMQGISPKEHAVSSELERIKGYFSKIKGIESSIQSSIASTTQDQNKNPLKVDKEAAERFIQHALAGNPLSAPSSHTEEKTDDSNHESIMSKRKELKKLLNQKKKGEKRKVIDHDGNSQTSEVDPVVSASNSSSELESKSSQFSSTEVSLISEVKSSSKQRILNPKIKKNQKKNNKKKNQSTK